MVFMYACGILAVFMVYLRYLWYIVPTVIYVDNRMLFLHCCIIWLYCAV